MPKTKSHRAEHKGTGRRKERGTLDDMALLWSPIGTRMRKYMLESLKPPDRCSEQKAWGHVCQSDRKNRIVLFFFSTMGACTHTRIQVKLPKSPICSRSMSCALGPLSMHRRQTLMETLFFTKHFISLVPLTTQGFFIR